MDIPEESTEQKTAPIAIDQQSNDQSEVQPQPKPKAAKSKSKKSKKKKSSKKMLKKG